MTCYKQDGYIPISYIYIEIYIPLGTDAGDRTELYAPDTALYGSDTKSSNPNMRFVR